MAQALKMKEIISFSKEQASQRLLQLREELENLKFKVSANDLKNVRQIRTIKQSIARLDTYLHSK